MTRCAPLLDAKKRRDLAVQALKGLHDEAVWVFLWQIEEIMGISKKVTRFKMRADNFIWARDAYVEVWGASLRPQPSELDRRSNQMHNFTNK